MKKILILLHILLSTNTFSADIPKLKKLFIEHFNNYYTPRFCGKNTELFLQEALKRNIDISNSNVLKIVGGGFLETSGFYSRQKPNERVLLGYFHMVLMADGKIFDFDLKEPLVLDTIDYIRLQFTPKKRPYYIFGINYLEKNNPHDWKLTFYDALDYSQRKETVLKEMKIKELVDIEKMLKRKRIR